MTPEERLEEADYELSEALLEFCEELWDRTVLYDQADSEMRSW